MEIVFWISALLLVHTYFGYPLSMAVVARLRRLPLQSGTRLPTVTAVVVMHNGAEHVAAKLRSLLDLDYPQVLLDVIIACDGCSDASARICRDYPDARIRVLEFPLRRGKAACLNDAVAAAAGEILLLTDVRQRLEPGTLRQLVTRFADGDIGAVSGELRFEDPETGFARGVDAYWRYEKFIRRAESRSGSTVGVTGALYAMRRELFRPLPEGTILDDVLNPMNVVRQKHRVVFESDAVAWDRPALSPTHERARKIRTLAGNYQLVQLAPWLLDPLANPIWYRFVCHKMLRLLAPWLMLAMLVASVMLAPRHALFAVALAGFLLAGVVFVAGRLVPAFAQLLPVRLVMTFGYLNWFSAEALFAFARNRRLHLW